MAWQDLLVSNNTVQPMQQELLDKHYLRKHGKKRLLRSEGLKIKNAVACWTAAHKEGGISSREVE